MKAKDITKKQLKELISNGKSSNDAARSLGVSQSSVLRKAKEFGLKFANKSIWRKF
jgi:transposase-like protein|tara:strand:+ start:10651 stop:10818 length:168 start_codon:yes stop_codon:yes gene_type:complete